MTRFDIYIRKMLLDSLSLSYLELTPQQEVVLNAMIDETYANEALMSMNVEQRVAHVVKQYQNRIYSLS